MFLVEFLYNVAIFPPLVSALDLGTLSTKGFNDPYVKVSLIPEGGLEAEEDRHQEELLGSVLQRDLQVPVTYDELADKSLLFEVFDYDRYSRNDVTGEVRIQMCEVDITSEIEVWSEIQKSGKGINGQCLRQGLLMGYQPPMSMTRLIDNELSMTMRNLMDRVATANVYDKVSLDRPEILLSLSYLPSAGRLTLVVLKAAHLVSPDTKDFPGNITIHTHSDNLFCI
ncbi:hypothetical protein CEXT_633401 [Caerostris extrusa]|uniref:C2 domain-containing protein n=1 Tax=Caerostris extrusa TaxID=172846 RepID=A0AAV4SJ11_CAEEX|nr:hypothetical protein CEXT_633401 [Caerostris extrusa]